VYYKLEGVLYRLQHKTVSDVCYTSSQPRTIDSLLQAHTFNGSLHLLRNSNSTSGRHTLTIIKRKGLNSSAMFTCEMKHKHFSHNTMFKALVIINKSHEATTFRVKHVNSSHVKYHSHVLASFGVSRYNMWLINVWMNT